MPENERTAPFEAFNFTVELRVPGVSEEVCRGAFAECDGLETTLDVKTIREGGNAASQVRLAGGASYGQVTLRRGMTDSFDAWAWLSAVVQDPTLRASGEIILVGPDRSERARYVLTRCLPVKVKAPALNAKDGGVAIEELQIAFDRLELRPGSGGASA